LPHKIDAAIEKVGPSVPVIRSEFVEKGQFGEDGWSIQRTLKTEDDA